MGETAVIIKGLDCLSSFCIGGIFQTQNPVTEERKGPYEKNPVAPQQHAAIVGPVFLQWPCGSFLANSNVCPWSCGTAPSEAVLEGPTEL